MRIEAVHDILQFSKMYMFLLSLPSPSVDSACLDLSVPNAVVSSLFSELLGGDKVF